MFSLIFDTETNENVLLDSTVVGEFACPQLKAG